MFNFASSENTFSSPYLYYEGGGYGVFVNNSDVPTSQGGTWDASNGITVPEFAAAAETSSDHTNLNPFKIASGVTLPGNELTFETYFRAVDSGEVNAKLNIFRLYYYGDTWSWSNIKYISLNINGDGQQGRNGGGGGSLILDIKTTGSGAHNGHLPNFTYTTPISDNDPSKPNPLLQMPMSDFVHVAITLSAAEAASGGYGVHFFINGQKETFAGNGRPSLTADIDLTAYPFDIYSGIDEKHGTQHGRYDGEARMKFFNVHSSVLSDAEILSRYNAL